MAIRRPAQWLSGGAARQGWPPRPRTAQARPPPTPAPRDRGGHARTHIHDIPHIQTPSPNKTPYPPLSFPQIQPVIGKIPEKYPTAVGILHPPVDFLWKNPNRLVLPAKSPPSCSEGGRYRRVFFVWHRPTKVPCLKSPRLCVTRLFLPEEVPLNFSKSTSISPIT